MEEGLLIKSSYCIYNHIGYIEKKNSQHWRLVQMNDDNLPFSTEDEMDLS